MNEAFPKAFFDGKGQVCMTDLCRHLQRLA
ncbi:hypothetical protein HDE77_002363 [Rhodanobacter sp. MP7CTX1]|nr:hypothetical protein [Rhodanobacter sp. MP7CTX1]